MFKRLIFLVFFIAVSLGVMYLVSPVHHTYVNVNHSFVIEEDFTRVKKILIRTNAVERMAELNGAVIEDSQWQNATVGMVRLTQWDVIAEGTLRVRVKQQGFSGVLYLKQKTFIGKDKVDTVLTLKEPHPPLQSYVDHLVFQRQRDGTTLVTIHLQMDVAKKIPEMFHNYMDRLVLEGVVLTKTEHELRAIVEEYRGQRIIIPINPK